LRHVIAFPRRQRVYLARQRVYPARERVRGSPGAGGLLLLANVEVIYTNICTPLGAMRMALDRVRMAIGAMRMAPDPVHMAIGAMRMAPDRVHMAIGAMRMALDRVRMAIEAMRMAPDPVHMAIGAMRMALDRVRMTIEAMRVALDRLRVVAESRPANPACLFFLLTLPNVCEIAKFATKTALKTVCTEFRGLKTLQGVGISPSNCVCNFPVVRSFRFEGSLG
jgi:hypothetical protein